MKSKSTVIWFMLAVTLGAAIWVLENYFQPGSTVFKPVFAGLRADQVTGIQVVPAGAREITVTRTNQSWELEKPIAYPAQSVAIKDLLEALEKLTPVTTFTPGEMSAHKNADSEFGFDNPQFMIDLTAGDQDWHLKVGNKTAPGDGVYVRVVGSTGAYVTDTSWLKYLPHEVTAWRDATLVDMPPVVDWLVITNGAQAIELHRDPTNRLWRLARPLQCRANGLLIVAALQQLRTASVSRFVSDDPKTDLASYGLEPAALDVWLGAGTNLLTALHTGKDDSTEPGQVFARREGWNSVVCTVKEPLTPWHSTITDFRDPNLFELTAPVAEVEVRGPKNYTLQQHGSNSWAMVGEKFPVDPDVASSLVRSLANLQIVDFVQDAVTASVLKNYGLDNPTWQITLRSVAGDTNNVVAQLLFGATNSNNQIYVKRGDEDYVYAVALDKWNKTFPKDGVYLRDRRPWSFSESDVAQLTINENGKMRQMVRNGTNQWSLTAGSGIIEPHAVEETVHELGQLSVEGWLPRDSNDQLLGIGTNDLAITIDLKSGQKYTIQFGREVASGRSPAGLAAVTLDGDRWAFVFPPAQYALVAENLTIPNTP